MPSKKKGKSSKQTKSIVTPKVSGKRLVDNKNAELDSKEQPIDLEMNTENFERSEVENSVEENAASVIDHPSEESEILKEEILTGPDAASEEKEHSAATSIENIEPKGDRDEFDVNTPKKDKRNKKPSKSDAVKLVGTSYHYFRGWLKQHLKDNNIKGFRFIKDDVGWQGRITIPSDGFNEAMKALNDFKASQPEGTKDLFW